MSTKNKYRIWPVRVLSALDHATLRPVPYVAWNIQRKRLFRWHNIGYEMQKEEAVLLLAAYIEAEAMVGKAEKEGAA